MGKTDKIGSDYMLVQNTLCGDKQAWAQLYNQSIQIVGGFTQKYLLDFQVDTFSCEDIVSEAYFRAFDRLNRFEGRSRFSSWVCGIVKRIIWTESAKSHRKERIYQQCIISFSTLHSRDPCDIYLELELRKSLWKSFENLHPIESYILENYIINEQTFHKLSKATHMPLHAVKLCYNKALRKYSENFHMIHQRK